MDLVELKSLRSFISCFIVDIGPEVYCTARRINCEYILIIKSKLKGSNTLIKDACGVNIIN